MLPEDRYSEELYNAAGRAVDDEVDAKVKKYNTDVGKNLFGFGSKLVRNALEMIPDNQQLASPSSLVHTSNSKALAKDISSQAVGTIADLVSIFA